MPEIIRPQITFGPDEVLQITTGLGDGFDGESHTPEQLGQAVAFRREYLDKLGETDGTSVTEQDGIVSISVDIRQSFGKSFKYSGTGDTAIVDFLIGINDILPVHPADQIDRILSLYHVTDVGLDGVVNHHFQRWLNACGVTEEVARQCVSAMSIPFGKSEEKKAKKGFRFYNSDDFVQVDHTHYGVSVSTADFGLYKAHETDKGYAESGGEVAWSHLRLQTYGDCADLEAPPEERRHVRIGSDTTKALYEMYPHNVDGARRSLSLVMGIGALAYHAARYQGTEDIFAAAQWGEPRIYPKA